MPQHPILPAGTRVRVHTAVPDAHSHPSAIDLIDRLGTIVRYETSYPEYHAYTIEVDGQGTWLIFDDEFEPVD